MPDEIDGRDRPLTPGTIGIRIRVIDYDGATGTFRTLKDVAFTPSAALPPTTRLRLGRGWQGHQDADQESSGD